MQTITPELEALLKSRLQAGPSGFSARFEVDVLTDSVFACPAALSTMVAEPISNQTNFDQEIIAQGITAEADGIVVTAVLVANPNVPSATDLVAEDGATLIHEGNTGHPLAGLMYKAVAAGPVTMAASYTTGFGTPTGTGETWGMVSVAIPTGATDPVQFSPLVVDDHATLPAPPTPGKMLLMMQAVRSDTSDLVPATFSPYATDWTYVGKATAIRPATSDSIHVFARCVQEGDPDTYGTTSGGTRLTSISEWDISSTEAIFGPLHLRPKRLSLDKSLQSPADQMEAEFENEDLPLGWGPASVFATNSRCRAFAWYGVPANEVQVFEGIVDRKADHRDVLTTTITARSMMALLIDQAFTTRAPQTKEEYDRAVDDFNHGAKAPVPLDQTPANGVYRNFEASDIVIDILDRAGWPADLRDVTPTSYVLDEYILVDGESWQACIDGEDRLTEYTGYALWDDEAGFIHFGPLPVTSFTDPQEASYTFRSGEDIVSLDDVTDQDELITRVKVRGPLTTQTLKDTWREVWRTSKLSRPVGIWYDPDHPEWIRVLDRGTKRIYKIRQNDRKILGSFSVADICPHPLGLSGDPGDDDFYWLLNAPWIDGGSGGNKIVKVRRSDGHAVARFALPDGNWSAIKVSTGAIWLTNLSTDKLYKRSKTDASAINSWHHTYNGTTQANPSGVMVDGSDLFIFYANGGTTARFLKLSTSAPGTVVDIVKTAGTNLHGGEMDTTTHTECYGDSDSLGLVAKFTLLAKVDHTREVFEEVVDIDLEDELGTLAQSQSREHDAHPDDADHPFEVRRLTIDLSAITNRAQAADTARRILAEQGHRRRIVDVGIIGNPAIQKTDLIAQVDPVTGLSESALIDTYRSELVAGGTYLGTLAVIPAQVYDDVPDDEGSGEDDDDIDENDTPDDTDPEEPVGPPPDEDIPDLPDATDEFMGTTIAELNAFVAALDDGTPDAPIVVQLSGTITGGVSDHLRMETRHDIVFVGPATLKRTARGNTPIIDLAAGCHNLRFSQVHVEGVHPAGGNHYTAYQHEHGFSVFSCTNVFIEDCDATNIGGDFVDLSGSTYWNTWSDTVRVTGGTQTNIGRNLISLTDGISNARIDHLTASYIGLHTFDFEPNGLTIAGVPAGADTIEIDNNTIGTKPYGAWPVGIDPYFGYGFVGTNGSGTAPLRHLNLHDNDWTASVMRVAVFSGIDASDIKVNDNTGATTFSPDANITHVIEFSGVDGGEITGNHQLCASPANIETHSGSTGITVSGNTTT